MASHIFRHLQNVAQSFVDDHNHVEIRQTLQLNAEDTLVAP
jgi:hypothetical protein